ncbi:uncharacterized protein C8Q71DRAFT_154717 [Rhodofomes roseus]|uniref:BTB domain-containing protein n=1 Tax=Rhodofomes roseus TaxID=34475 RepID=A0ABQ8K9E2_9APHY|nr:uncharacterized protein C8Q71DRAFT_154717 [Rhodofomes roseus]KAH9833970.1 hypothetical protein C8Q71DRAFT_154717 [Rhodofomes roseus]
MNVSVQEVESTAFVRDEELWFPDGNVVLEAQGRAFRVYQGLLAHHSEIFRDLFTVPQPTTTEMYEECPIVHLTDQPEDLRQLLRVIYHGNRYYPADEQLEFAIVAALVRMSHKYAIEHIRDSYLSRMKSCFCEDLDDFRKFRSQSGSPSMKLCVTATDAIAAVNIARLTETLSMLPSALFFCCLLKTETLINGHPRADGTLDCLSPADVIKCIDARLC